MLTLFCTPCNCDRFTASVGFTPGATFVTRRSLPAEPTDTVFASFATEPEPSATEFAPLATEFEPSAVDCVPVACDWKPIAVEPWPCAVARKPIAVVFVSWASDCEPIAVAPFATVVVVAPFTPATVPACAQVPDTVVSAPLAEPQLDESTVVVVVLLNPRPCVVVSPPF